MKLLRRMALVVILGSLAWSAQAQEPFELPVAIRQQEKAKAAQPEKAQPEKAQPEKAAPQATKTTPAPPASAQPPTTATPPVAPPSVQIPSDLTAAASPSSSDLTAASRLTGTTPYRMMGDQPPLGIPAVAFGRRGNPNFPNQPGELGSTIFVPSVRGFKISENESVEPVDRVSFTFNYYQNLNKAVNDRFGADLQNINAYREFFGLEKTFLDGQASIGLKMPLNSLEADSGIPGLGGSSTDVGDLSVILKYRFAHNPETGDLLSAGLVVTAPTGPDAFAGFENIDFQHNTTLQPFVGYKFIWDKLYLHGFLAADVPVTSKDVTMLYNDIGVGYLLYRTEENRCLRSVVPTFEVHVNTPLNHRGAFSETDRVGTPDVINLTLGTTFELGSRSFLALGVVTPVTGPKPMDVEALVQFNWQFGGQGR